MDTYKNWLTTAINNRDGSIGGTGVEGHIGVTGMQHNHKRLYSLLHCSVIHDHYGDTRPVWAGVDCNLLWRFFIVLASWNTDGMCISIRAETNTITIMSLDILMKNLFVDNSIFVGAHTKGPVFIWIVQPIGFQVWDHLYHYSCKLTQCKYWIRLLWFIITCFTDKLIIICQQHYLDMDTRWYLVNYLYQPQWYITHTSNSEMNINESNRRGYHCYV